MCCEKPKNKRCPFMGYCANTITSDYLKYMGWVSKEDNKIQIQSRKQQFTQRVPHSSEKTHKSKQISTNLGQLKGVLLEGCTIGPQIKNLI